MNQDEVKYVVRATGLLMPMMTGRGAYTGPSTWTLATILSCPACGAGRLRWAEAGYVPGYRVCDRCGRGWTVSPKQGAPGETVVELSIPEVDRGHGPEPEWSPPAPDEIKTHEDALRWQENGDGANPERAREFRGGA